MAEELISERKLRDKGMYRLNCLLPPEFGTKISEVSKKQGMTKVAIVAQALTQYFQVLELQDAVLQKVKEDPALLKKMIAPVVAEVES